MWKLKLEKLKADQLSVTCSLNQFACKSSAELFPLDGIVGQQRAVRALNLGLQIQNQGFNIFVVGTQGTGRTTAVKSYLEKIAAKQPVPSDWCYVFNFGNPRQPRALELPQGKGKDFVAKVDQFLLAAKSSINQMLESEEYSQQRENRIRQIERQKVKLNDQVLAKTEQAGFQLQGTQTGLLIVPLLEGKPISPEAIDQLPPNIRQDFEKRRKQLETELRKIFRKIRKLEQRRNQELDELEKNAVMFTLDPLIIELQENYTNHPQVLAWIHEMATDITENLNEFIGRQQPAPQHTSMPIMPVVEDYMKRYGVNLIVDNAARKSAPIVMLPNPTYSNLFGQIEKEPRFSALVTDFSMIKSGALHEANGGYLVLPARELLTSPLSYSALKRALQTKEILIEEASGPTGALTVKSLDPEPIPLTLKVIVIGEPMLYQQLYLLDPEFRELFKVKAEFDTTMDRTDENIQVYGAFVCMLHDKEDLRPLTADAIAAVVDYSSRLADNQTKLSIRFDIIADIIREANFYAQEQQKSIIEISEIKRSLEERIYRSNLLAEKIRELIEKRVILITTDGNVVGQVNGLSVLSLGDFSFGRPQRVTASVALGRGKIVDIEREAKLGGPLHTKGVLILSGYLANKFGKNKLLGLAARIVFEQSYSGIDGDSASSTELYALLSVLSDIPIQQRFAVTGSVNQHGEVQAIGCVNEKIEGYFEVCKAKGLTGNHAVIIPKSNMQNLMLKDEVIQAVRTGKFHIYAVETIDEGIELLTGIPAGKRLKDGTFPEGTVNALVDARLTEMSNSLKEYSRQPIS